MRKRTVVGHVLLHSKRASDSVLIIIIHWYLKRQTCVDNPRHIFHWLITMYKVILLLGALCSLADAGPLNLFVNVTIDDRPDLNIVEGDIAYDANVPRNAYTVAAKWTGGLLPYVIDGSSPFSAAHIQTITGAMRKIEQQTNNCIRFVQRTNQPTWLRIYSGTG